MTAFIKQPSDGNPESESLITHVFKCDVCIPSATERGHPSPYTRRQRMLEAQFFLSVSRSLEDTRPLPEPGVPLCGRGRALIRQWLEAQCEWAHWTIAADNELDGDRASSIAESLFQKGTLPFCPVVRDLYGAGELYLDDYVPHFLGCHTCRTRGLAVEQNMSHRPDELLASLEDSWRQSSGYVDVRVRHWKLGTLLCSLCPHDCYLDDLAWRSMMPQADLYLRVLCCRAHRYARLFTTDWLPPEVVPTPVSAQ